MPDKKIVVNGVEVDLANVESKIQEQGIDRTTNYSDILWSSGGKSTDELLMDSAKIQQEIQKKNTEKEYDGFFSAAGKFIRGVFHQASSSVYDTIAAFDLGDWRTPGGDGTINNLFAVIDDTIGDGENEVGNWFSTRAAQVREYSSRVDKINTGYETLDYVLNNLQNIVGSAGGFVASGVGVGKGVNLLSKGNKWINTIGTSSLMTQAGSISIAENVYNQVYREFLAKNDPNFSRQLAELGDKAYNEKMQNLSWYDTGSEAEMSRIEAEYKFIEGYAKSNPALHAKAAEMAAKGADTAIKINSASFFLNMLSSARFFKGATPSRNIIGKQGRFGSKKDWVKEGLQEAFEEGVVENIAEKAGLAVGNGKNYGLSDAMATVLSKEALESAVWGAVGGVLQTGATEAFTYKDRKSQYDKQQEVINKWDQIGKAAGQPEVLNNMVSFSNSVKDLVEITKKQEELYDAGMKEEADALGEKIYYNQALHAFKTGTTESLLENYEMISKNENLLPEVRKKATEAIAEVKNLEKIYNESQKYLNADTIYRNRTNDQLLKKTKDQLQSQLVQNKVLANEDITNALKTGELSLRSVLKEKGEKVGDLTIKEGDLPFSIDTLFENNFEDENQKKVYSSFLDTISSDDKGFQSVRNMKDLTERIDLIDKQLASNNKDYNKFTSKSYQKSLVAEAQLAKSFEQMKPLLTEESTSDKYESIVDNILSKYKNRILPERLKYIKDEFMSINEAKKELEEQQQTERILRNALNENQTTVEASESDAKKLNITPADSNVTVVADQTPVSAERQQQASNINQVSPKVTKPTTPKQGGEVEYFDFNSNDFTSDDIENQIAAKGYFAIDKEELDKLPEDQKKKLQKKIKQVANMGYDLVNDKKSLAVYNANKLSIIENQTFPPTDAILFEPDELADNISPEIDKQIKDQVSDFYESLKSELESDPSFEDFIRDFIKHSSRENADKYFNVLVRGWENNNYREEDYKAVYNKIFRNRKEIASTLASLAQQAVNNNKEEVKKIIDKTVKDQAAKENPPTFTPTNRAVYEYRGFTTHEERPKFAFRTEINFKKLEKTEDDTIAVEYDHEGINKGQYVNSLKLLNPDKYNAGEKLTIKLPDNIDEILVPIYNQDGTKGTAMQFGKWVRKRMDELNMNLEDFKKTQEYIDKIPMFIYDDEGEGVALVHDVGWYNSSSFMETEPNQLNNAVYNTRFIRQEVLKGNNEIVITEKRGGVLNPFKIENTIKIKDANPQAIIAIADGNGDLISYERDGTTQVIREGITLKNSTELRKGVTYDVRKTGKDTYTAFPVFHGKIDQDIQDSIFSAIKLYLNAKHYDKSIAAETMQKIERFKEATKQQGDPIDLSSPMGLDKFLKKFIKLESARANTVDAIHSIVTANQRMPIGAVYMLTDKGKVIFGKKGTKIGGDKEFLSISQYDLNKKDSNFALFEQVLTSFTNEVLPEFMRNVDKLSLIQSGKPLLILNKEGNVVTKSSSYHEYLMTSLENNIKSLNVGDKDNPIYVTAAQPVITFELTNNAVSKKVDSTPKKAEPKIEPVPVQQQVINNADRNTLTEAVTKAEEQGEFTFIGSNTEEKVDDLVEWVNDENANKEEVKEFVEEFVNIDKQIKEELNAPKEFVKKNLFTVKPIKAVDRKKALAKASIATKFIGWGTGITGSSTEKYRLEAGEYANTGSYTSDDVVFLSAPGKRGLERLKKENLNKIKAELDLAIEAGATIVKDDEAYLSRSDYNEGEKEISKYLKSKGYQYSEVTVDYQKLGVWSKNKISQDVEPTTDSTQQIDFTKLDEKVNLLVKQAEQELKWLEDDNENFYEPFELTEQQVEDALKAIDRIPGISPQQQYYLVDYIYNRIASEIGIDFGSKINTDEINKMINSEVDNLINQSKEIYKERIETINTILQAHPERYEQLKSILSKYEKAIQKSDNIKSNTDNLIKEAKRKLFKFTGISEKPNDIANEDNTEEVDDNNEVEKNFSKTSLEENGKLTSSYRLKRFLSGIPNIDKNGVPTTALLGVPTFVGFDSVYEVLQAQLADIPADFNLMMAKLEESKATHPWIENVISKLKTADKIIQNEFVSTMNKHSLEMEFVMYSYNRETKNYSLKIYNTNANAIKRIIKSNWDNNLKQSPLIKSAYGSYEIDKEVAIELLNKFNEWQGQTSTPKLSRSSLFKLGNKIKEGEIKTSKPITDFNRGSKFTFTDPATNKNYIITKKDDTTYILKEYSLSLTAELISKGKDASKEAKEEGIKELSEWLSNFGIELSQGTWEDIIERGFYHSSDGTRSEFTGLFHVSENSKGFFGLLANKLKRYSVLNQDQLKLDENKNYPLEDSAIDKDLVKIESKFTSNIVPNVFRDAGKAIYGFTPSKFITDRAQDLKNPDSPILEQLQSLSFSQDSLWLNLLANENGFRDKFDVTHLGLNAIKEMGKKLYRDNGITGLADADHELTKLGAFQDTTQGGSYFRYAPKTGGEIKFRIARVFSPTMSDKTTMTMVKTAVADLQTTNFDREGKVTDEVLNFMVEQLVVPELKRIINFHQNVKETNIKSYDDGAQIFLMLPALNDIKDKNGDPLIKVLKVLPDKYSVQSLLAEYGDKFKNVISTYVDKLVQKKKEVWRNNGFILEDGTFKYLDGKYLTKFESVGNADLIATMAANDYVINQLIANSNSFMTFIGDPAMYYKANPKDSYVKQSKETFINVGKRLAAQIAPGNKLADSNTNKYIQVFLDDNKTVSQNIEYLTKLLDGKSFDSAKWNAIQGISDPKERKSRMNEFLAEYPKSADYFSIESTDAQEYTTWKEHLYVLEKMGKTPDAAIDITPEEIREAREMFANEIPYEQFTDKQKAIYKKVLQPIKPVYTGQVYDPEQDVMRVVYIKTSSFPLLPQVTKGLELDRLRTAMEDLEKTSQKTVRASYGSGNKVGSMKSSVKMFGSNGIKEITADDLNNSSLVLERNNFRIQQDVPFKSAKRNEDTVTLGTQTTKLLFGNGITDLNGFDFNGTKKSGLELHKIYNDAFIELIKFKRDEFYNELGLDKNGKPIDVSVTVKKLQKVLKEEAEGRGYPKQDIEALGVQHVIKNGKVVDVKFTLPIWLAANSNRYEALLNAIVTNRISKIKMPGNSYPVGSQEGFKFSSDFKDIDQNKIVFTSKWKGELEAANKDSKGNFIKAQVLAPSKFRDNDGNLIDLFMKKNGEYVYVTKTDKGFQLKEEMFDSDLFNLTSFRIPTSGHVSMAQVEIVGFLPYEVGDLMIVPKNFTKQKGLDFDIDKENTYQYWHIQDENGKFSRIDKNYTLQEIENKIKQEPENKLWKKLKEKHLQNTIVEVHKSVLTNPDDEIQKKINSILSIDFAKEQAEMIDNIIQGAKDETYFTPLDDEYQKAKMGLGAAGKIGIGAYSIDVVFNSLAQQQRSLGKPLRLTYKDGDGDIRSKMFTFGNITSFGNIGEIYTLDGGRTIAEVMAECQNIATDNEKEQVMGRVNLNSYTLDVHKVFNLLGFDKGEDGNSIPLLFLSQPIIRDYAKAMADADSNISEFTTNKEEKVVEELLKKYKAEGAEPTVVNEMDSLFTTQNMLAEISGNFDPKFQAAILHRFLEMKNYGVALRAIQGTLNVDSKGLGKSTFDSIERIKAMERIAKSDLVQNVSSLMGDYVDAKDVSLAEEKELLEKGYIKYPNFYIKPNTIVGAFGLYTSNASLVWEKYLPYDSIQMASIFEEVLYAMGKEDSGSSSIEKKQHMLKEMKKYLYSNPITYTGNPQQERARLFFDKDGNQSLASYLQNLFNSTELSAIKKNKLINRFQYQIETDGNISKIIFNNSSGENFDEDYLYNSLLELAEKNIPLPDYNGESYNTRKLVADLINYSFLEGGVQEAIQFTKYIPVSLLKAIGFNKYMQDIHDALIYNKKSVFGINPARDEDNPHLVSRFTMQYAQHNPEKFKKVKEEDIKDLKGLVYNGKKELSNLQSFPNPFGDKGEPVTFLSLYNSNIPVGKKFQLYYWNGTEYSRIPVLGVFGMSEYDANRSLYPSLINEQLPETKPNPDKIKPVTTFAEQPKPERMEVKKLDLGQAIEKIANNTSEEFTQLAAIAKALKPYVDANIKFEILPSMTTAEGGTARGGYNRVTNTVSLNAEVFNKLPAFEAAKTLLHETVHALTVNHLLKYSDTEGNVKNQSVPQYITKLIRLYRETEKHLGQRLKDLRAKGLKSLTAEEKRVVYGGYDLAEFISMIMTQPEFQQEMSKVKYAATDQSLLNRFVSVIKDILNAIGVNFESNSVTSNAISTIFEFIDTEQSSNNSNKFSTFENTSLSKEDTELTNKVDKMTKSEIVTIKEIIDGNEISNEYYIGSDGKVYDSLFNNEVKNPYTINKVIMKVAKNNGNLQIFKNNNGTFALVKGETPRVFVINTSDQSPLRYTEYGKLNPLDDNYIDVLEQYNNSKKSNTFQAGNKTIHSMRSQQINYTNDQSNALNKVSDFINNVDDQFFLLAGFAGTGKTTIAENIFKYAASKGYKVEVLAPTNKAASRLREKLLNTGITTEAKTIHKAMYGAPDPVTGLFVDARLENKTVYIIDEASMITQDIMDDIKNKLPFNSKAIFLGDGFQLEPVGKDPRLFKENTIANTFGDNFSQLKEVKRQEGDILAVATTMRLVQDAVIPSESTEDFIIEDNMSSIEEEFKNAIANGEDAVFIVPVNKERIKLNNLAREVKFGKDKSFIQAGEQIAGIANSIYLSNSDIVTVKEVISESEMFTVSVEFGSEMKSNISKVNFVLAKVKVDIVNPSGTKTEKEMDILLSPDTDKPTIYHGQLAVSYGKRLPGTEKLANFMEYKKNKYSMSPQVSVATYGYSITAHKSQGSEWDKVFVSPSWLSDSWDKARWVYTAITRAKKKVHFLPSRYTRQMKMSSITSIAANQNVNKLGLTDDDLNNSQSILTLEPTDILDDMRSKGLITEYCK